MTDERLRALERRALASGDAADRAAWLAERVRAGQLPRVGLVFLDDLHDSAEARSRRSRRPVSSDPLLPPTVLPPPVVVLVAHSPSFHDLLAASAAWLGRAAAVLVLHSGDVDGAPQALPGARAWIPATGQRVIDAALRQAQALARDLDETRAWRWLPTDGPAPAPAPRRDASPWVEVGWERYSGVSALAPRLCAPGGQPALLEPARGARLDLSTGERAPVEGLAPLEADRPDRLAAAPSGTAWATPARYGRGVVWTEDAVPPRPLPGGFGGPIGVDPAGRVAWAGGRTVFWWRVPTPEGLALWTQSSHDWPCGHAKKLRGTRDNDPRWVHLAPDASTCLSVYGHDALLTPGLPLRWRDRGSHAAAERVRGEPRALLFQCAGPNGFPDDDPLKAEENARDRHATVTLGPTPGARYCVGLEAPTYRLVGETVTRLGGPVNEWVVYDDGHQERQRHRGRLLGGWDRWVVVLEADLLVRVDLVSGERLPLGSPGRPFTDVIPVAGTPHVLLVQAPESRDATTAWVRMV